MLDVIVTVDAVYRPPDVFQATKHYYKSKTHIHKAYAKSQSHLWEFFQMPYILESSSKCCAIQIDDFLPDVISLVNETPTVDKSMERRDTTWYILTTHDASGSLPPPGQTANGSMSGDPNPSSWTGFGDIILKRLMAMAMDSSILFGRKYFFKWAFFLLLCLLECRCRWTVVFLFFFFSKCWRPRPKNIKWL